MRKTTVQARTLLELCVARAIKARGGDPRSLLDNVSAIPKGQAACGAVMLWAVVTKELGHVPTTVEFADFWRISERMGWKYRARVVELFPDEFVELLEHAAAYVPDVPKRMSARQAVLLAPDVALGRGFPVAA
jgi:hypothetical protein